MIEYARNAPKKMDVDIFLLEYLVYIGTCTANCPANQVTVRPCS